MIKKLSELSVGERGVIVNIVGKGALIRRLLDMGIVRGVEVRVVRKAPLGDPIEFEIKGYYLSLRKDEASHVFIEVVK
ncbi:MAG: ferrous iron transport protein A [Thermoprotei archaeon]|nr:MAG: ferrous iron transport protein A [Thermoprotei archaeon]